MPKLDKEGTVTEREDFDSLMRVRNMVGLYLVYEAETASQIIRSRLEEQEKQGPKPRIIPAKRSR